MSNSVIVTIDIDWACEPAIEETLSFMQNQGISPTVFTTHRSEQLDAFMQHIEVGLHPFFDQNSSHGSTIREVVDHVLELPHNLKAFRCHRFAACNASKLAMAEAGMLISSNVCTDLEIVPPFRDRFGFLEVPIFLEDGGYLWRKHSLEMNELLEKAVLANGVKVILIHPMHFCLNTPDFNYMSRIKQSLSREAWKNMTKDTLNELRWKGRGIRDLLIELIALAPSTKRLSFIHNERGPHNHPLR